jgi:CRP-like cAMP-binding protein
MKTLNGRELLQQLGIERLQQASTFGALSPEAVTLLMHDGTALALETGEYLFRPGEAGDSFFIILAGVIAYYRTHEEDGTLEHLTDYDFGKEIGFVSMAALLERKGIAQAAEPSCV